MQIHPGLSPSDKGWLKSIENRWADGKYDRLPDMTSELARREVASALAAKAARGTTIRLCAISHSPRGRKVLGLAIRWRGPCGRHMQRRKFIILLGGVATSGVATTWPLVTLAQQPAMPGRLGGPASDEIRVGRQPKDR